MNPYQGLKLALKSRTPPRRLGAVRHNANESLSGIETRCPFQQRFP